MGWHWAPVYGELDLGSAIETAEKVIAKIKTNKFDKEDLKELDKVLTAIKEEVAKDEE
jgi:prefoldin subunit 5